MGDYSEYRNRGLRGVDGMANAIILTRKYPGNSLLSFLLVEGPTDKKLFISLVDTQKCQITIAYGKDNIRDILAILEQESIPGVLAIRDADFAMLEGKMPTSSNQLLTDAHDIETMLIQSPALEKVLNEFGSENKISTFVKKSGKGIRTLLLDCGQHSGYLLWLSLREGLAFDFDELDFTKFVDGNNLEVDILRLITHVKERSRQTHSSSSKQTNLSVNDIYNKMQQLQDDGHDLWHVCSGHDLTHILSIGLRKVLGTHNAQEVKPEQIEIYLRLAYERAYFQKTRLYTSIQTWQTSNTPFVILKAE